MEGSVQGVKLGGVGQAAFTREEPAYGLADRVGLSTTAGDPHAERHPLLKDLGELAEHVAVGGFLAREGRLPNAAELDALYRSLQTLGQPLAPTQPTPPTPTNSNLIPGTVPGVPEPRQ